MAKEQTKKEAAQEEENKEKTCFVIMPISDVEGYDPGHFKRVYEHIIKPACIKAGFTPIRADDIKKTNVIVIDILQRLLNSDMAICDLSSKNPNVLYELGVRQAFDKPVSFIKDDVTDRIFDIQGFRDIPYNSSLRIDQVDRAVEEIAENLTLTYESKGDDINSVIELLGITKAKLPDKVEISVETDLILKSIHQLGSRLTFLERAGTSITPPKMVIDQETAHQRVFDRIGQPLEIGDRVKDYHHGLGIVTGFQQRKKETVTKVDFDKGAEGYFIGVNLSNIMKLIS